MNRYVIFTYLITCVLMVGDLIFTFYCYRRSERFVQKLEKDNEKKV